MESIRPSGGEGVTSRVAERWILLVLRIGLGTVFIYAGALKWSDPWKFAEAVAAYKILPESLVNVVALVLPMLEMGAGLLMFTEKWAKIAALIIVLMCLVFFTALVTGVTNHTSGADGGIMKYINGAGLLRGAYVGGSGFPIGTDYTADSKGNINAR